jgi:hypothetical protein
MKKILTLIFGIMIAIPAICQTDTVQLYIHPGKFENKGEAVIRLLHIKLRKVVTQQIMMGMDAVYVPETDVDGGNARRSKTQLLTYQLPLSVQVTEEQKTAIASFIKNLTEPVVVPKPDLVFQIDNIVQPINQYSAGWNHYANNTWNANHHDKTMSVTYVAGSTLTVQFTGYKFEWWTEKRMNHGIAAISIDGGAEVKVDLYEKREDNPSMKVYDSPILTDGLHTIKLRMTGEKNPVWQTDYPVGNQFRVNAQETNILHDKFVTYRKQQ